MTETRQFLIDHGPPILFGSVFLEQIGLPLPALPLLLAAGALAATGQFNTPAAIGVTVAACVVADSIWFFLGRFRGHQVLGLLCRISLEPDSCVRRTQNMFTRYGWRGIIFAKFVPGLGTVAPPLAGMSSLGFPRFLFIDGIGSLLYGGVFIFAGFLFSSQIEAVGGALARVGGGVIGAFVGVVAAYIGFKYWQRRRVLEELRMARITTDDLRRMMNAGQELVILDIRSSEEFASEPGIQGAIHLTMDDVKLGQYQIPRDREVIVYCSCPNEATAARVALLLRSQGFTRVRPLLGGIDAWREHALPADELTK